MKIMFVPRSVTTARKTTKNKATIVSPSAKVSSCSSCIPVESEKDDQCRPDDIVLLSKDQRWPVVGLGEPVCVVCGRYGAYIVDETDRDVCSMECKRLHLNQLQFTANNTTTNIITATTTTVATPTTNIATPTETARSCGEPSSSNVVQTDIVETRDVGGMACSITRDQAEFLRKQVSALAPPT